MLASALRIARSSRTTSTTPVCRTLTTTCVPSVSVAKHTCPIDADAMGTRLNDEKRARACSDVQLKASASVATICSGVSTGSSACRAPRSSATSGPTRSGRVLRICPIFINVVPSSSSAARRRSPRDNSMRSGSGFIPLARSERCGWPDRSAPSASP